MVNNGIVVFISGRGSNLNAIINAVNDGVIKYPISAVVSDRYCEGIEISRKNKLNTLIIDHKKFKSKLSFEKELIKKIKPLNPNLIVLAGFMQILSISFIKEFKSKIINIHPSLLPSFKGLNTHARAKEAGVLIHGCTIHFVNEEIDSGKIIAQGATSISKKFSESEIENKILNIEHILYPKVIAKLLDNEININEHNIILCYD